MKWRDNTYEHLTVIVHDGTLAFPQAGIYKIDEDTRDLHILDTDRNMICQIRAGEWVRVYLPGAHVIKSWFEGSDWETDSEDEDEEDEEAAEDLDLDLRG